MRRFESPTPIGNFINTKTCPQVRVLRAMDVIEPKNVIIGQYGKSLDGSKPAYKEDDTVPKDSRCPTFCAMAAYIRNERWDGVPFIMKAGKGMLIISFFSYSAVVWLC